MKNILLFTIAIAFTACIKESNFDTGKRQLAKLGYSDIKDKGFDAFGCVDQDEYSTAFEATDKDGNAIKGCFCSSGSDSVTIKFK